MDGWLCAEREHHTERAREKDGKTEKEKEREIGKQKKGERKYPREESCILELKFTLLKLSTSRNY